MAQTRLVLTGDEAGWVTRHPIIRYAPERDYGPFVYLDPQGQPAGLSIELLHLLAEQVPLRFEALPAQPLDDNLKLARQGRVDLLTSLRPTPERAAYLDFTSAYVAVPASVIIRANSDGPGALAQLSGQRVAVGRGYAVEHFVRERYPAIRWQPVSNDEEGLRAVRSGEVAAMVADEGSFAFLQRRHGWSDLQLGRRVGFDYRLSFAYRKDWPELGRLLERALRAIPPERKQSLLLRWLPTPPENRTWRETWGPTLLALGLIATGLVLLLPQWRRYLSVNHDV
ncbi:transporter substrate-binding domain-containing protein [Chitinimonas lacunae]|uniref:Transporter substrate-binding domain-containing protein n=1 Tax=Chitinimonas lacunae TaxID=1963018 RepID=A0ABV8MIF0_9NEIS